MPKCGRDVWLVGFRPAGGVGAKGMDDLHGANLENRAGLAGLASSLGIARPPCESKDRRGQEGVSEEAAPIQAAADASTLRCI